MPNPARGSRFEFRLYEDSTYGTVSAGQGVKIPVTDVSVALDQSFSQSGVLQSSRNMPKPFPDAKTVKGPFTTEPDSRSIGWLLKHQFSAPTGGVQAIAVSAGGSSYATPPTVNFSAPPAGGVAPTATAVVAGGVVTGITVVTPGSGYTTAPTITFSGGGGTGAAAAVSLMKWIFKVGVLPVGLTGEKFFTDLNFCFQYPSLRLNELQFDINPKGRLVCKLDTVGTDEVYSATPIDATPNIYSVSPFLLPAVTLSLGDVGGSLTTTATAKKFSQSLKNNLDPQEVVGNGGVIAAAPEAMFTGDLDLTLMFTDVVEYNKAKNFTPRAIRALFPSTIAGHSLQYDYEELMYAVSSPVVQGPGGVVVDLKAMAFVDAGATGSAAYATLINDVMTYAAIP